MWHRWLDEAMDRVIFGDNQFFGIDHLSEEQGVAKAIKFKESSAIIDVLNQVYDMGIKTFMCTTHERMNEVCDYYRENANVYDDFKFYPCMPYAHKYANALTEQGIFGALKYFTKGHVLSTLTGGLAASTGDMTKIMQILVDAEMRTFEGLNTPVIFLQNVVTDLLLGMGATEFFISFSEHVKKKYNAEAGFITMNMPHLVRVLNEIGMEDPIVCSSINKIGFRMPGGIEAYENTIRESKCRLIAMQILAAGAIKPCEAVEYVCNLENIESILFGASTISHIRQTKDLIDRYTQNDLCIEADLA
jgi:hypothetical protein